MKRVKNKGLVKAVRAVEAVKKAKSVKAVRAVKAVDRQLEIEKFGKLISTRPTRIAKSKKKYDRKTAKRQVRQILGH